MPAISPYRRFINISDAMFFKNKYARIEPKNSEIPDIKVYSIAFVLLPVPKYNGTEMLIPSGILWSAIAIANVIPNFLLAFVVRNVAIPSGCIYYASRLL